jgi:hypothetical protein
MNNKILNLINEQKWCRDIIKSFLFGTYISGINKFKKNTIEDKKNTYILWTILDITQILNFYDLEYEKLLNMLNFYNVIRDKHIFFTVYFYNYIIDYNYNCEYEEIFDNIYGILQNLGCKIILNYAPDYINNCCMFKNILYNIDYYG